MLFNDLYVFPAMADIDGIRPSFDEEVELTPCFRTHKFRCSWRFVVAAASVGQMLILKNQ